LAGSDHGLTSADLLERVGGSRSGLYALLNTLKSRGYVETDGGTHRVGPALWSLVPTPPVALESLIDHFRVETMDNPCPETAALVWPDGDGTVIVSVSPAEHTVRVSYDIGERRPASGVDARVFAAGETGGGTNLESIRRDGHATDEVDELVELAAPVCRDGVRPIASLLVGIPSQRANEDRRKAAVSWLRSAGAHLSHRVGANSYQPYGWSTGQLLEPSSDMSDAELDRFLTGLWSAQLACVRSDGTPHVVPLWYEWDGSALWLAGSPGASWRQHIATDPNVSITLDEQWPPLRRVFISGSAREVAEGDVPGGVAGLRSRLATRYLGRGADTQPELVETDGWAAVRVTPERMHGRRGLGLTGGQS
jgi:DNA-binding IclR family transcriptional regulator